jgi:cyclase
MKITLLDQCLRVRVTAVLVVCVALSLSYGARPEPLKAAASQAGAAPSNKIEVLEVRPSFFVIASDGANIGVQVGEDGLVVVDAGTAADAPAILAAIKRISPKPIRYLIDTGPDADHVGGNEALSKAGEKLVSGSVAGGARNAADSVVPIVSAEGVLRHMAKFPSGGWPTEVFHYARKYMYLNGEAIEIGGSIQGEITALNRLVDLAVPSIPIVEREAGTIVVPGHGHLCDQFDVVEYRDMVTIIRDRVRDLIKAGRSLAEVKAAQPAKGYMGRYGNSGGAWTTDKFVEAVYRSLAKEKS